MPAVVGNVTTGDAVLGASPNVGVHGTSGQPFDPNGPGLNPNSGVFGESAGNHGVVGATSDSGSAGVWGTNDAAFPNAAVLGTSTLGHGVHGVNGASTGTTPTFGCGLWGESTGGFGVYGHSINSYAGYFEGNVYVTGTISVKNDILLVGADCAEQFDLQQEALAEPGTVLVIDAGGALRESRTAYDRAVAGVISGAGTFRPGLVLDGRPSAAARATVALVGKVYCKVDADVAAIQIGDLLTTSDRPGHAMKMGDPSRGLGAVIGKALQSLPAGQALIPILVALQ